MVKNSEVLSQHFYRDKASYTPKKIAPEEHKSMQGEAPTVGSYGHTSNTVLFRNGEAITVTSNNRFPTPMRDYLRNGPVRQIDDYYFGRWVQGGTDNPPSKHSLIPKMPNLAYITGITPLRMHFPNERDTPTSNRTTPRIVEAVDINKIGFFESTKGNLYNDSRNLMFDNANRFNYEVTAWIDFLGEKGWTYEKSKNNGVIALGIYQDDTRPALAGHFDKGYLIANPKFLEGIETIASKYGLSKKEAIEAFKRHVLLHEIGHVLGIPGDRKGEETQGMLAYEFYSRLAEETESAKLGKFYKALTIRNRDYAEYFSKANHFKRQMRIEKGGKNNIEKLVAQFLEEGKALGYGENELNAYVNLRLNEVYGALLRDEVSENKPTSKTTKSSETRKRAGLEKLIETLEQEAEELGVDKAEYISAQLAKHPIKYMDGKDAAEAEPDRKEKPSEAQESEAPAE
ncbi:hypothetical protein HYX05_01240 [Candidatus Woesearchaeota archaeon]|nr:hypothetical protein [Candidatus Woesearchaeota archaeon]